MEKLKSFWSIVYRVWPPFIRLAEFLRFHHFRQRYLLGRLNPKYSRENLKDFLLAKGFELTKISWHDPGEALDMRKVDKEIFQYHIRLFADGEIHAHYEYSPESHPWGHFWESRFGPETEFFDELLGEYLVE